MSILDREWITCCERADLGEVPQPPYLHQCGYPVVESICKSESISPSLCGFSEASGYESTPPKKYLTVTSVGSGSWTLYHSGCDGQKSWDYIWGGSGSIAYSALDCSITESGDGLYTQTDRWTCLFGEYTASPNNGETSPAFYIGFYGDATSSTVKIYTESKAPEDYRKITNTLSSADTEAAALTRATPTAGLDCSSLSEIRTVDYDWTVRTASYALKATNLMIGAIYTARVELESQPAIKDPSGSGYVDESGDPAVWTSQDDEGAPMIDEYTFTATASEMLVPTTGTWADDNTDQVIDIDEVTPAIEIPHVVGMEYRIKAVRIELALT